jgi:cysteinyl-tRNA synthetase
MVYNSLTRRKQAFQAQADGEVKMFVCGPTVYDYVHLGHARTYLAFDLIVRYLKFLGYRVNYLMNITDVAERVVQRAERLKRNPLDLAHEYEAAFLQDMRALGIRDVDRYERASDSIPKMITQVSGLIEKGAAYESETGVYFEVNKFPKFGKLSGQSHEELGLRRLELCSSKRNPEDFSLWRKYSEGLAWDSPWGRGRPGWHIEDTAISMAALGETYDVHGGASELIFPHHEAEIAQAEALTGKAPFVRYWLHTGLLNVDGRKMSKSLGNVIRIRDALRDHSPTELRFYFASFHYRAPMVFSKDKLVNSKHKLDSLRENFNHFLATEPASHSKEKNRLDGLVNKFQVKFRRQMNNDFYAPGALSALQAFAKELRKAVPRMDQESKDKAEATFRRMADVIGILT